MKSGPEKMNPRAAAPGGSYLWRRAHLCGDGPEALTLRPSQSLRATVAISGAPSEQLDSVLLLGGLTIRPVPWQVKYLSQVILR